MSKLFLLLLMIGLLVVTQGCGNSSTSTPGQAAGSSPAPSDPIARVVHEFLEAVRTGDTPGASARLTPLALQRISENDMTFAPPASETARFTVGLVEMIEEDKAIVESIWTERDSDGQTYNEKMTWALRLGEGQWRISGMAAEIGPNQPPVVMDFENPGQLVAPPHTAGT
jgi:hypothetical protein